MRPQKFESTNFVAPYNRVEILPPEPPQALELPAPAVTSVTHLATNHVDRAQGFALSVLPLAAGAALGSWLLSAALSIVPLLSVAALTISVIAFMSTWGIAYALHTITSPDGVALSRELMIYRLLRHEQRDRHARYWESFDRTNRRNGEQ